MPSLDQWLELPYALEAEADACAEEIIEQCLADWPESITLSKYDFWRGDNADDDDSRRAWVLERLAAGKSL